MQVLFFIFSKFFPSPARESSPGISRGCSLPVTQERAQAMVRVLAAAAAVVAAVAAAIIPATTVVAAATAAATPAVIIRIGCGNLESGNRHRINPSD